jgi:hypothetical protein
MTKHICEGDNETDLKGRGWEDMDWIHLDEIGTNGGLI